MSPSTKSVTARLVAVAAVAALGVSAAGCAPPGQKQSGGGGKSKSGTLTVGVKATDSDGQIYYAKELGYFEDAGLDVKVRQISSGAAIASGVASESLDVGSANVTSIATSHAEGLPFVYIGAGSMYHDDGPISAALAVTKDSPVKSAADLEGKTVAVNGLKNITEVAVRAWADANGGDSDKIKFVEFPFPQMPSAVDQGKVDAAFILEPALSEALGSCCRVLGKAYGGIAEDFMTSGWVTTEKWVKKNPEKAEKFAEVMEKTARWANKKENHDRTAEILVENLEIEKKTTETMRRAVYGESLETKFVQPQIDSAAKYGIIPEPFDASEIVSTRVQPK